MAMVKATGARSLLSKIAMNDGHGENSPYFEGWKAYERDPFHPKKNPKGIIQMGLAENQLSFDLVEEWIKKNPKASICTVEGVEQFKETANFDDYHGLPEFRNAVAKFMKKVRGKVNIDPDRIVMSGGATGAHELFAFCLADPGEAFLVPSPYYSGFDRDLSWRTGVQLLPVICESSNDFKITRKALEEAYERAQENIRVKGVLITNPSNPLGTLLDKETLKSVVSFVNQKNIHLVCDEIYAATVFSQPRFTSIAEVIEEDDVVCNRDLIHIVYSLSKDLGFPGFRVGIVYSYNDMVMNCARKMSSFGLVSTQTQRLLACMLSDDEFVDNFLVKNSRRLLKRYKLLTWGLSQVGISCLKSNAGLYCWMDLRPLLKEPTEESERELWRTIVHDVKLNVSPGSSFHCTEPGWFMVCFANMDEDTLTVALTRMRKFMFQDHEVVIPAKTRRFQAPNLRLIFSSMRFEDASLSLMPCMSPHSPLVKAPT